MGLEMFGALNSRIYTFLICIHNLIAMHALHQLTPVDMMFIIPIARYKIGIPLQPWASKPYFFIVFYSNSDQPFPSTYTHLLLGTTTQMETTLVWFMMTCKITVLLHLDESLHLLNKCRLLNNMWCLTLGLKRNFLMHLHALVLKYPQASDVTCSTDFYERSTT